MNQFHRCLGWSMGWNHQWVHGPSIFVADCEVGDRPYTTACAFCYGLAGSHVFYLPSFFVGWFIWFQEQDFRFRLKLDLIWWVVKDMSGGWAQLAPFGMGQSPPVPSFLLEYLGPFFLGVKGMAFGIGTPMSYFNWYRFVLFFVQVFL